MKSWITVFGRYVEASGFGAYMSVKETNQKFQISGEGREFSESELRCIRECIDRLLPRKKS